MKYSFLVAVFLCSTLLFPNNLLAENAQEPLEAAEDGADEILVISRRVRETSFDNTRSAEKVSREKLERLLPRSVSEALGETPGVAVQKTNHGGGSPIVRGLVGPQVLLTVDGVRMNNAAYRTGPVQYLNLFDPFLFDSFEVLRGTGSVLYGSDAVGGVIRLNPLSGDRYLHSPEWTFGGQFVSGFRSADRSMSLGLHLGAGGRGTAVLGAFHGYRGSELTGGGDIGEQPYSSYKAQSGLVRAIWNRPDLGPIRDFTLFGNYLFGALLEAGRADNLYTRNNVLFYDNVNHLAWMRMEFSVPAWKMQAQLLFSFQRFYEQKDTSLLEDDYVTVLSTTRDHTHVSTPGLDASLLFGLHENLQLQTGGMLYRDFVSSDQMARDAGQPWLDTGIHGLPDGSSTRNWGLFAFLDAPLRFSQWKVSLSAGSRIHGAAAHAPAMAGLPAVDYDTLGVVFFSSAKVSFRNRFMSALVFSQGFRAPSLHESAMLGDEGKAFHVPNGDLKPETLNSFEWILRMQFDWFTAGTSLYASYLSDIILRRPSTWQGQDQVNGKDVVENYNGADGRILGAEGHLEFRPHRSVSLIGAGNWTKGDNFRADGSRVPLSRIPPLSGLFAARVRLPGFLDNDRFFGEAIVRGARKQDRLSPEDERDARIPEGGTPGWVTLNARLGWSGPMEFIGLSRAQLLLSFENLTNEAYKIHGSGVFGPGRGIHLGLSGTF